MFSEEPWTGMYSDAPSLFWDSRLREYYNERPSQWRAFYEVIFERRVEKVQ